MFMWFSPALLFHSNARDLRTLLKVSRYRIAHQFSEQIFPLPCHKMADALRRREAIRWLPSVLVQEARDTLSIVVSYSAMQKQELQCEALFDDTLLKLAEPVY